MTPAGSSPLRAWRTRLMHAVPALPVLVFLVITYFVPLALLLSRSVVSPSGQWTLEHFIRLFETSAYVSSLLLTLKMSLSTAALSVAIGYPLAFVIARAGKSLAMSLVMGVLAAYWAGVLVRTFAWLVVLGRNGPINSGLAWLGITERPIEFLYHYGGVMMGMVNAWTPLAVLVMVATMQTIDQRLIRAASTLGAGGGQAFWRIFFPLSMPGLVSAFLLVFMGCLGTFVVPALLGSGRDVMVAQVMIVQVEQLLNWGFAGAIGVLILLATLLVLAIFAKVFGMDALLGRAAAGRSVNHAGFARVFGRNVLGLLGSMSDAVGSLADTARSRLRRQQGRHSPVLLAAAVIVLAFLLTPTLFLVPMSIGSGAFIEWPPKGFSLRWYELVLGSGAWVRAGLHSIYVAVLAAAFSVALTLPAAIALTRRKIVGQKLIMAAMVAPMIIPHILLAVALFLVFAPLGLVGTDLGLVTGHTLVCVPYTFVTLMAILSGYDQRLDQAACTLGARSWQRLWHVTLPLIKTGLLAAFLIAFITSFEELTIALFVTGGLSATLPKQLWSEMILAASPALAAVSTLMLVFVLTIVAVVHVLKRRSPIVAAR
ncbi:MAG: ABC transporter permease subunit [Pseudomonadota bacterium]